MHNFIIFIYFFDFYRTRQLKTVNQIVDALEELISDGEEEEVYDSDVDKDYVDTNEYHESSSDDEPAASSSKPTAKRSRPPAHARTSKGREVFHARKPQGEVLVFLNPPDEKADGDTDFDSGKFMNRIFFQW